MKKILTIITVLLSALVLTSCTTVRFDDHYTIVFYMGGLGKIDTVQVEKDSVYTRPADPTSVYADFVEWYAEPNLVTVFDFSNPILNSLTIYAKWDYYMFDIVYQLGEGGINHPNNPSTIDKFRLMEKDTTYNLSPPTRQGFIFRSWHFEEDFSDAPIVTLNERNIREDTTTIYARWRAVN